MVVQFTVQMSYIDLYIRMLSVETFQSFRCCDNKHAFDIFAAMFLDHSDCVYSRTASCKHRVCDNDQTLFDRIRQFAVIFVRLMCLRISVKSDVSDLCRRNKCSDTIDHSKSGTKYRNNSQLLACDHR